MFEHLGLLVYLHTKAKKSKFLSSQEVIILLQELEKSILKLNSALDTCKYVFSTIDRAVQLQIVPDLQLGEVYFRNAKIIFPATIKTKGYYVFSLSLNFCKDCGNPNKSEFKQVNEYGLRSLDDAIIQYVDRSVLETVMIAQNTEKYTKSPKCSNI